jgi:two-component system sensor histidine kinase MtrB
VNAVRPVSWSALWVRARRAARRASRGVTTAVRGPVHAWRGSLQLRVVTSALVIGMVALTAVGVYVSDWIRDGLYEQRVSQLLADAAGSSQQAEQRLALSEAPNGPDANALFREVVGGLRVGGAGQREVFLLRSPEATQLRFVSEQTTDPELREIIPEALRERVQDAEVQQWVPVDVDLSEATEPGVVIGSVIDVPWAGRYELYYLYSLASDQTTLAFLQQVLLLAGGGLVVLLGGMTWLVTRQTVQPVRIAARVAERLADGHLTERMAVRGEDEMATLARSFNEMAQSLQVQIHRMEELSRLQRRFVSDVSHELRTPLTTIRIAAEILYGVRDELDPAARRSAELLTAQLDRFESLLADLLEMSRFDAGAAMLDAERSDVRDVVLRAVDQATGLAARRGVWLSVGLPERAASADIDPRRVERILRNLLVNAIEHAEGNPVDIRLASDKRALAIVVRDHGFGMSQEEAEHVFDRFWRADPARARTTGGTGLGLAISLEDAHLHGGWLQVWARQGRGANFRLTLPKRAGITLVDSPLPLVPEDVDAVVAPVEVRVQGAADPAAVPDLDRLEAS